MTSAPFLLAVMGPTASGKTDLAEALAEEHNAQLINADAFQVYRGMDIGTAKPVHHDRYAILDIKNPNEKFSVGEFCQIALQTLRDLFTKGQSAIVVGGTGLYIRALFQEYADLGEEPDPELRARLNATHELHGLEPLVQELRELEPAIANQIDLRNPVRVKRAIERHFSSGDAIRFSLPSYKKLKVALVPDPSELTRRIDTRTEAMVHNGWVEETQRLLELGYSTEDPGFRAIGYQQLAAYLRGETELEEAVATTIADTKRYAKRQRTWLRSEPDLRHLDCTQGIPIEEARQLLAVHFG